MINYLLSSFQRTPIPLSDRAQATLRYFGSLEIGVRAQAHAMASLNITDEPIEELIRSGYIEHDLTLTKQGNGEFARNLAELTVKRVVIAHIGAFDVAQSCVDGLVVSYEKIINLEQDRIEIMKHVRDAANKVLEEDERQIRRRIARMYSGAKITEGQSFTVKDIVLNYQNITCTVPYPCIRTALADKATAIGMYGAENVFCARNDPNGIYVELIAASLNSPRSWLWRTPYDEQVKHIDDMKAIDTRFKRMAENYGAKACDVRM